MPDWIAQLVKGFVEGLIRPILQWWSAYRQGKQAQHLEDMKATLEKERKIRETVDSVNPLDIDDEWLRRGSGGSQAPGVPPPKDPAGTS